MRDGEPLPAIVRHVLIHEIGHHFGFSDEDMERIEAGRMSAATRRRSSGKSSASNQGFCCSHAVVRQLGCGSGKCAGRKARHSATVSVMLCRRAQVVVDGVGPDQQGELDARQPLQHARVPAAARIRGAAAGRRPAAGGRDSTAPSA